MGLRKIHIEKIAKLIVGVLGEEALFDRVTALIAENMEEERRLEDEAYRLLDKHRRTFSGDVDEQKALLMVKRQLAKQKNFVL